jgi:hypothetical protein
MPTLLLSGLIVLRLLMPPGICVCKLSSPALRVLAILTDTTPPAPPAEDDHEHLPGCPASHLAEGLGVAPPSGPGPFTLPPAGWLNPAAAPAGPSAGDSLTPPGAAPFDSPPLYVRQCALLI